MRRYVMFFGVVIMVCQAVFAVADESEIVVTATRSPREAAKVPASVTVINRSEIDNSGAWNVDDLLRRTHGVFVLSSVGFGSGLPSQINIRGVPGQHATLLLVDGMPLNESASGYTSVNEVPVNSANSVEIVRGPFSALYGTDAFAGVVNVITRNPEDMPPLELRARIGGEGFQQYSASGSVGDSSLGFTVNVDTRNTDNYLGRDNVEQSWWDQASQSFIVIRKDAENYDYGDQRLNAKFMMDIGEDSRLELFGRYYDSELGYGQADYRPLYPALVDSGIEDQTLFLGGKFSSFLTDDIKARFLAYYREQEKKSFALNLSHMMGTIPVYAPTVQTTDGRDWKAECGTDIRFSEDHLLVLGADLIVNDADFSPLVGQSTGSALPGSQGADESVQNTAVFLQDEFKFMERFELISGLRLDMNSEFGEAWSPKAGLLCEATEDTVLRASVGRAYRAPTLLELFQPATMFGNITFVSNPDLDPEYIVSADLGVEHTFSDKLSAHLDVFYNDMDELIVKQVTGSVLSFDNVGDAWSAGVEAGLDWDILEELTAFINYTGQQTEDEDTGENLEHMPEHALNIGVTAERKMGDWVAMVSLLENFIGERGYVDFSSGLWQELDSYWRTDISTKLTYAENAWIGFSVENVTDEEYQEWPLVNRAPSRLYAFEAGYRF